MFWIFVGAEKILRSILNFNFQNVTMYNFKQVQKLNSNLYDVFEFFQKPENLAKVTPRWINFKIKSQPPLIMKEGAEFEYTIKFYGIPVYWKTRIAKYSPPNIFIDEQLNGPYKIWIHTHKFQQVDGHVVMEDSVDYDLHGGILKGIIHNLFVKNSVRKIFEYRKAVIEKELKTS